jgi:hypothetical protein
MLQIEPVKSNILVPMSEFQDAVCTVASINDLLFYWRGELGREADLSTMTTAVI